MLTSSPNTIASANEDGQTALLFAQCMNAKLPRKEGIPPEVKSWSEFAGGKMM